MFENQLNSSPVYNQGLMTVDYRPVTSSSPLSPSSRFRSNEFSQDTLRH
jgi:hypothetical protein